MFCIMVLKQSFYYPSPSHQEIWYLTMTAKGTMGFSCLDLHPLLSTIITFSSQLKRYTSIPNIKGILEDTLTAKRFLDVDF